MPKTAKNREKNEKMSSYDDQIRCHDYQIDPTFWENPYGVDVAHDVLKFLYIPDHVSAYIAAKVAHKVYRYQIDNIRTKAQITHAVMITMGGLLPGVLLYDHLAWTLNKNIPPIEFGTLGVKYYAGPGQPLDQPRIVLPVSIDVKDRVVGNVYYARQAMHHGGKRLWPRGKGQVGAVDAVLLQPIAVQHRRTRVSYRMAHHKRAWRCHDLAVHKVGRCSRCIIDFIIFHLRRLPLTPSAWL